MKRVVWISATLLLMILLVSALSCSKKSPTDPNEPGPQQYPQYNSLLDGVQFEPASGPPGTMVTIIGLDSLPADSGFTLYIGSQPAPLISSDAQPIKTTIPIYMDSTKSSWPITPSGLQTVLLLYNGSPVDSVPKAIRVDSLAPAPEAMDSAMVKLSSGATALKQIALAVGAEDTLLLATCDAMDELLYTGTYSVTALLNGTSPVSGYDSSATKIFSSLMVSSGMLDMITRWSDTLVVASDMARKFSDGKANADFLTDEQLASRMQLHDYLAGFGSQVVGQTALEWQTVSAVLGGIAIAAPVVGVYEFIVSWVLGELDFIINKIAIAMFPSDVTRLDLDFYNHQINVGDTTEAIVRISAKNNPPNITPADIIGQVLAGLQLTQWIQDRLGPTAARTLRSVIQDIVNWALGVITNILNANYNSPTSLDVALPAVTWDSVWIHNPGLIDLISPDLSKIGYINGSFNGLAKDSIGTVGLQMRTQPPGPSMYIGPIMNSLGYAGGAFGDDLTTSNVDTVAIVSELALEVDFANTISVDGANILGIDAGYYDSHGNSHWAPGIDISLSVTDGAADVTNGVTDAQGHFSSTITIDSTADSVTVHVYASGAYNAIADTIVIAQKEGDLNIDTHLRYPNWNCAYARPGEVIPLGVTVYQSDSGTLTNAQINAWVTGGGSLGAATGTTDAFGKWSTDYTAPQNMTVPIEIHIEVTPGFGQSKTEVTPVNRLTISSSSGPVFAWGQLPDTNMVINGLLRCGVTVTGGPDDDGSSSGVEITDTCNTGFSSFTSLSIGTSTGFQYGGGGISTSFNITEASPANHTLTWNAGGSGSAVGEYAESSLGSNLDGIILYRKPSGLAFPAGAVLRTTLTWTGGDGHELQISGLPQLRFSFLAGQRTSDISLPQDEVAFAVPIRMYARAHSTENDDWELNSVVTIQMECINCGD